MLGIYNWKEQERQGYRFIFLLSVIMALVLRMSTGDKSNSEELFSHRKPGDKNLPKTGEKDFAPDGSWLHGRRLDRFHQEWKGVISEQRVEKLGNLVVGKWNPDRGLIEFEKEQGKFWAHMGFVDHQRKWLYPEEALYLMETSILEVKYGGVPLSIQQAYCSFLGTSVTLEEYQVYAHMRRLGFVVIRHRARSGTTRYERTIQMDQHLAHGRRKRKLELGKSGEQATGEGTKTETETSSATFENDGDLTADKTDESCNEKSWVTLNQADAKKVKLIYSEEKKSSPDSDMTEKYSCISERPELDCDVSEKDCVDNSMDIDYASQVKSETDFKTLPSGVSNMSVIQTKHVDFSEIDVPSVADKRTITLKAPVSNLLPKNVIFPYEECELDISSLHLNSTINKRKKGDWLRNATVTYPSDTQSSDFSFPKYFMGLHHEIKARNWKEYKAEKTRIESEQSVLEKSPVSHLWSGDVTPLVRPQDAVCTANLLNKLRVVQELDMKSTTSGYSLEEDEFKIVYDIYQPGKSFKKSRPGIPHYRVIIQQSCSEPPSLGMMTGFMKSYNDDVPLIWAVINSGEMTFYNFSAVSLPIDINMG